MRALRRILRLALWVVMATSLASVPAVAGSLDSAAGWTTERDVDPPGYAVIEPRSSDLNIDVVVLACELTDDRGGLQLQLYLTNDGPLMPLGAAASHAKGEPRAEISIDGHAFPVDLLFAEDHVALTDDADGMFPRLSARLLDAVEQGTTMRLRFDLLAEPAGQAAAFDGEAVVDLQTGQAGSRGKAVAAVRRCATGTDPQSVALASRTFGR